MSAKLTMRRLAELLGFDAEGIATLEDPDKIVEQASEQELAEAGYIIGADVIEPEPAQKARWIRMFPELAD